MSTEKLPNTFPPPSPGDQRFRFTTRRLPRNWGWWVGGTIGVVLLSVGYIGNAGENDDTPRQPVASAGTCARLQKLIDGGMTKRAAIDYAIIQADEPELDDILRDMLYECD